MLPSRNLSCVFMIMSPSITREAPLAVMKVELSVGGFQIILIRVDGPVEAAHFVAQEFLQPAISSGSIM